MMVNQSIQNNIFRGFIQAVSMVLSRISGRSEALVLSGGSLRVGPGQFGSREDPELIFRQQTVETLRLQMPRIL